MEVYPLVPTFFMKPQVWLFHVVVLLTTAKKWTKVKNARAGRAKLSFLPTKYANLLRSRCRRRYRCLSSVILYFRTPHNTLCLPPKFSINYSFQMLLGTLHIPKST